MIVNINEFFGDSAQFSNAAEMAQCILDCGYDLPEDGLKEGRDYEVIE